MANNNFSDPRLTERLARIVLAAAENPSLSLPSLFDSAGLEGAYRFFSNPKVEAEEILGPHFAATRARAAHAGTVLVVHDTTDFSFGAEGEREGLGRAYKSQQTFYGHFSIVLAADGSRTPLGLTGLLTWARDVSDIDEHGRWLKQVELAETRLSEDSRVRPIHVMDRECDDYVILSSMMERGRHFVVRSKFDRWTDEEGSQEKLRTVLATAECAVERTATLSRRTKRQSPKQAKAHPPRAQRTAKLSVSARRVSLVRPKSQSNRDLLRQCPTTLDLNVVRVWEASPPDETEPVEWILLTSEPIDTEPQLLAIIDHYRARWTIEEYFKALKTGCSYERRQLQDYESLVNLLATFAPIAYMALLLRTVARQTPEAPASIVISDDELFVLRARGRKKLPPEPTARDILLAVAALGGHIAYAPDPGWLTISRGYAKLATLTEGYLIAKNPAGV